MSERDESQNGDRDDQEQDDEKQKEDEQRERAFDLTDPVPEPGVTAPLHHVTDEERKGGPTGMSPGTEPDPGEGSSDEDEGKKESEGEGENESDGDDS